jgi:hypothetical protein
MNNHTGRFFYDSTERLRLALDAARARIAALRAQRDALAQYLAVGIDRDNMIWSKEEYHAATALLAAIAAESEADHE